MFACCRVFVLGCLIGCVVYCFIVVVLVVVDCFFFPCLIVFVLSRFRLFVFDGFCCGVLFSCLIGLVMSGFLLFGIACFQVVCFLCVSVVVCLYAVGC